MISLRVHFDHMTELGPVFEAHVSRVGECSSEKDALADWVSALEHPEGVRRLREALAAKCAEHGIAVSMPANPHADLPARMGAYRESKERDRQAVADAEQRTAPADGPA